MHENGDHLLDAFLQNEQAKDLLRITTAGSVDDGKSTLIGRLLYDSQAVYEDQLAEVAKASAGRSIRTLDLSYLTDGLRAEREQGITIDVAYRYFATAKRKFIIADVPGHEQYTRNMATGASNADVAVILMDARKGLLPQSRRHAAIIDLLGLTQLVVAVNKMDLVDYDGATFDRIEQSFRNYLSSLNIHSQFIPVSAFVGDNVVNRSQNMPWYSGPNLVEYLESVPVATHSFQAPFRFAAQSVVRPNPDYRGYAGTVASGTIKPGAQITVYPSGQSTSVATLDTYDGTLQEAGNGDAVTITLAKEMDIRRGDLLVRNDEERPQLSQKFQATLLWLNATPARAGMRFGIKHMTHHDGAQILQILHVLDVDTLGTRAMSSLEMNDIGVVQLETTHPLAFDVYRQNRLTGSFILIDQATNATVAAGMIAEAIQELGPAAAVTFGERHSRHGHVGAIIRLSGRPELATRLERYLFDRGCLVLCLESPSAETQNDLMKIGAIVIVANCDSSEIVIDSSSHAIAARAEDVDRSDEQMFDAIQKILQKYVLHSIKMVHDDAPTETS
jgi:sulfate adenylyltransferase large subunit